MNRALLLALLTGLLFSACSRKQTAQPAGRSQSPPNAGAGGTDLASAAAKVTDACGLIPAELAQQLVPGAAPPQGERFPPRCTVGNGKSALEITIDPGPDEPVNGAEFIPGLASGGYLERLDPVSRGDVYLTVILGKDASGMNHNLHVEVAGHDEKDHKEDALAVAREILARLH